jgi:hypothetical protein
MHYPDTSPIASEKTDLCFVLSHSKLKQRLLANQNFTSGIAAIALQVNSPVGDPFYHLSMPR